MSYRKKHTCICLSAISAFLLLFPGQAVSKGVFLCFNDPLIKGDSTQINFVDCIDANSVNLTINNDKEPYCVVSVSFDIGLHSPAVTLAVTQSTPLKEIAVFIITNTERDKAQQEILLDGFIAKKISMQGEGESMAKQKLTLIPDTNMASPSITLKYRTSGSGGTTIRVLEENISCKL